MRGGADGSAGAEVQSSNTPAFHIIVLVSVFVLSCNHRPGRLDLCTSHAEREKYFLWLLQSIIVDLEWLSRSCLMSRLFSCSLPAA